MRKEDLFKKNHILGVEFDRYLLEHPEVLEEIPEDAQIYFLPEDDPELSQENFKMAEAHKAFPLHVRDYKMSVWNQQLFDPSTRPPIYSFTLSRSCFEP